MRFALRRLGIIGWSLYKRGSNQASPTPFSFEGSSDELKATVIVPTLDSPLPQGKSAIWCVSFELAWSRLKNDVVRGPVQIANAQAIADRLNGTTHTEADLNPDAVFAAAGLAKDGIVEHIHTQMANKFPKVPRPAIDVTPTSAVAYAYLAASSKFEIPFFENDEAFWFTDSAGKKTSIKSFGIRGKDDFAYHQLREQVEILYSPDRMEMRSNDDAEFVLDPCKTSQPYQIVVARVNRKETLAETVADVEAKIAQRPDEHALKIGPNDTLLIPSLAWKISHRFKELEGTDKQFTNAAVRDYHLDTAMQTIQFRLNRGGAELASESPIFLKPVPTNFEVNRPFLVYMKKRGGTRPFFVAWIENAELLETK